MPAVRLLTWNSTGESQVKAQHLTEVAELENNDAAAKRQRNPGSEEDPPVSIVVIQEASRDGAIRAALGNRAANQPFSDFAERNGGAVVEESKEGGTGRQMRYLITWLERGNYALTAQGAAFTKIDLCTDIGVSAHLQRQVPNKDRRKAIQDKMAVWRMPAFRDLEVGGSKVRFITWHAPTMGQKLPYDRWSFGVRDAFFLWGMSSWYTNNIKNLPPQDIAILAGDLNATAANLQDVLDGWDGASTKFDHVLAYRNLPVPGGVQVSDDFSYDPNSPPETRKKDYGDHRIVVAKVNWKVGN